MEDYGFKVLEITNKAIEDAKAQAYSKFYNYNFVTNAVDEEKTAQTETIESAKRVEESHDKAIRRIPLSAIKCHNDPVNHPKHYAGAKGMEVIDVIENFTSDLNGIEATDTGNIIKYILRWKHKNGVEDLEKAQWYLNHLINKVKENNDEN